MNSRIFFLFSTIFSILFTFHSCNKEQVASPIRIDTFAQSSETFTIEHEKGTEEVYLLGEKEIDQILTRKEQEVEKANKCTTVQKSTNDPHTPECCCVDILYHGQSFPGIPPGIVGIKRRYTIFEATNYYWRFSLYKEGDLWYESNPYLNDAGTPCNYQGFSITTSAANECPGDITIVYKLVYLLNGVEWVCDSDTYTFYWPGNPPECSAE